jgi:hypothetical protein
MITEPELWEQADIVWDTLPEIEQRSHDSADWQFGFVAGCKLFIARMEHRGLNSQDIRQLLGMDA